MPRVTAASVPRLLPYLEAGLAPAASAEQYAGALIVTAQLASRANLAGPLTEALLEGVAKGARAPLRAQALQALLCLCRTQAVATLPSRAFKHLAKLPELASHFSDLCRGYRADALAAPLVRALASHAATHANYERTLAAVVKEAPLSDDAVNALVDALAELATFTTTGSDLRNKDPTMNPKGLEEDEQPEEEEETRRAIASRVLRLTDAYHPAATSRAVDRLLARNEREKRREAEAETETETETARASSHHPAASSAAARDATEEFLRGALAGSASGPMPGHAASLGAALDHPSAGLREAALRELRRGGLAVGAFSSSGGGPRGVGSSSLLSGALLRRVVDDHPRVAALAASLPDLRRGVGDDAALFDAARERLGLAASACGGKSPDAELERAAGKRLAKLACGTLAVCSEDAGEATGETKAKGGEGAAGAAGAEGADSDSDTDSDSDSGAGGAGRGVGGVGPVGGPLAGRAASLAFGYLTHSPATRAIARATLEAAKRNPHFALAGLRSRRFESALAKAADLAKAPAPGPGSDSGKRSRSGKPEKPNTKGDAGARSKKPDKEARARADAATNRAIVSALAEGLGADPVVGGDGHALGGRTLVPGGGKVVDSGRRLWALETWRDGSPRARATLLLALREAVVTREGTPGGAAALEALWATLRAAWETVVVVGAGDEEEEEAAGEEGEAAANIEESTFRSVAKNRADAVPSIARSAFRAVVRSRDADAATLAEAFARAAAAEEAAPGRFRATLERAAREAAARRGDADPAAFLASRAGAGDDAVRRAALELLGTLGGTLDLDDPATRASAFAALVSACGAKDPKARGKACRAVAALAPKGTAAAASSSPGRKKKGHASSASSGGDAAAALIPWRALAGAAGDLADATKSVDARETLREAFADALSPANLGGDDAAAAATTAALAAATRWGLASSPPPRGEGDPSRGPEEKESGEWVVGARALRRLVATFRGVGDAAAKANALAPALRRACRGPAEAEAELELEAEALAVDVLECAYADAETARAAFAEPPLDASETRLATTPALAAFLSAMLGPSAAARTAAFSACGDASFFAALPPRARARVLAALFAAVGRDPDAGARTAARNAVDSARLAAGDFERVILDAADALANARGSAGPRETDAEPAENEPDARRPAKKRFVPAKKRVSSSEAFEEASEASGSASLDAASGTSSASALARVDAAIAALEVLSWKSESEVDGRVTLAAACQRALAALLDDAAERARAGAREVAADAGADAGAEGGAAEGGAAASGAAASGAATGGYAQSLALSTLEMLARADADSKSKGASGSSPGGRALPAASSSSSWDVALATRAVRDAEAGPAREAALLYLATLAEAHPEGVLSHVLDVSAALADVASDDAGGGERDDALSRKALERALAAVVPAWISGGLGVAEAAAKVVDALPDVPPHRRATLCVALLDACPDKREGLPRTLTSLLARADALETAAREKAARRARRAKRRAEKEAPGRVREEAIATAEMEERAARESTAWVMDLAAGLLAREPATTAVDALAATMRVRRARERSERLFRRRGRFSSVFTFGTRTRTRARGKRKRKRASRAPRASR